MIGITDSLKWVFNLGFTKPPGGEIGSKRHVLNDHTYCCQIYGTCDATGEPQEKDAKACKEWHEQRIGQRDKDAEALGVPLAISEFGSCMDTDDCVREINQVTDVCDEYMTSWAYWQFKTYKDLTSSAGNRSEGFYNIDGSLQAKKVKALSRTYIQNAQGLIKQMQFDTHSGVFKAVIHANLSIKAPTDIYLHKFDEDISTSWYPNGYEVHLTNLDKNGVAPLIRKFKGSPKNTFSFDVLNEDFDGHYLNIEIVPVLKKDTASDTA